MISVRILERGEERIEFEVSGISTALANALRRTIIADIPVMAIEKVRFYENSSILSDDVLAARLGLIPLTTDLRTYNFPFECKCGGRGCARCTAILVLDARGPATVYAEDLKPRDPKVKPAYPKIPIVKLHDERQSLKLEAYAQLGVAKDHAKWQAGLASYEILGEGKFRFFVESYGQLPVEELVEVAFKRFETKIKKLRGVLEAGVPERPKGHG